MFSCSGISDCVTSWTVAGQASLSFTISLILLKLMSIELMIPSNHLILCCPFLLMPFSFPASGSFPMSPLRIRWSKYRSFSFSISPSNEYPGLISFRIDWFDLLAVQEALKSLLQHYNSKASILQCSAFFMFQFSHPSIHGYWKNHSFDLLNSNNLIRIPFLDQISGGCGRTC